MKVLLSCVVLFAGLVPAARAEGPEEILRRLGSEETADRAWGAWLAGEEGLRSAVPLLVGMLRSERPSGDREARHFHGNVLDALIRLDARVPPEALTPWLETGRTEALVLAARDPAPFAKALLARFDAVGDDFYPSALAVGNLLSRQPPPGFAIRLLDRARLTLHLVVRDPGKFGGFGGGARSSTGFGDGRIRIPEGFPPRVIYTATLDGDAAGATLLADGPTPVFSVRRVFESDSGFGSSGSSVTGPRAVREWLAELTGGEEPFEDERTESIDYTGPEAYRTQAIAIRDAFLREWLGVVRTCHELGLVTREEATGHRPDLTLDVRDVRERKTVLPPIPPSGVRLVLPDPEEEEPR